MFFCTICTRAGPDRIPTCVGQPYGSSGLRPLSNGNGTRRLKQRSRKDPYAGQTYGRLSGIGIFSSALFEQGRTFVQTNQCENAEDRFSTILSFAQHSAFHAKALVELGLIRINTQKPDQALEYYKEVLQRYPGSPDAENALAGIENVYMARNDSKGFFEYLESLGIDSGKSPGEKEMLIFSSAEQLYLNNSYAAAVTALNQFVREFPGKHKQPAAHFAGECYSQLDKMQLARQMHISGSYEKSVRFLHRAGYQTLRCHTIPTGTIRQCSRCLYESERYCPY